MLRSPSAGKLLQYTVDDGGHVAEGNVFAEIEVSFAEKPGGDLFLQCWWTAKVKPTNTALRCPGASRLVTFSPVLTQVMKIIMTLVVEEAGRVHYVKRPGALLEVGCVIARLELDDPTKVKPVSLPGAGHAAVPSCLLPSSILGGTGEAHWGTKWSFPHWGISRDVSPCWHRMALARQHRIPQPAALELKQLLHVPRRCSA